MPKPAQKPTVKKDQFSRPHAKKDASGSSMTSRLKLAPSQLASAFRHIKPTWRHYLDYIEAAAKEGDDSAKSLLSTYYGLTRREQAAHMPEELCELSGVKPEDLFAIVAGQLWRTSRMEANLIVASSYPRIIERTAKLAQTARGIKDREIFHKATGFLPQPKGPSINIDASHKELTVGQNSGPRSLPPMEEDVLSMESAISVPLLEPADPCTTNES